MLFLPPPLLSVATAGGLVLDEYWIDWYLWERLWIPVCVFALRGRAEEELSTAFDSGGAFIREYGTEI